MNNGIHIRPMQSQYKTRHNSSIDAGLTLIKTFLSRLINVDVSLEHTVFDCTYCIVYSRRFIFTNFWQKRAEKQFALDAE